MAIELGVAYINILPSAKGIQKNIQKELAPLEAAGVASGKKLGTNIAAGAGAGLAALPRSASTATGAGERVLQRFALRTGGLFQALDRQLGNFGGPFTGNLTTIGTSLRTVAAGERNAALGASELQRVGTAAYLGIGLAAAGFGAISIKAALGAEQAHAQLEQAIKKTKGSYDDYGKAIDGAVEKLAKFGFDQEEVEASLAKLTRASKDPAKALQLVGIAADIAHARNVDLGTASQILVNIEAGRVRGLAQLGISTKDATGKTIDAETALKRITALYGGAAAANAKTYQGQLQAVGAEAHNLEERIGGALLPVVANLGHDLLVGVDALKAFDGATGGVLGNLSQAAFVFGAVLVGVFKLGGGLTKLIDLFKTSAGAGATLAAAETASAEATAARVAATVPLIELEQAEIAASLDLTAAQEALAEAVASTVASEAELAALSDAVVVAEGELAAATAATAGAMETETVAATGLGVSLSALALPLAAVAAGFIIGKKGGDVLNDVLVRSKPNVEHLTASLLDLEKGKGSFDFSKLAGDLGSQISVTEGALKSPRQFGQSLFDAVTGGDAHQAKADIDALNKAFIALLQTEGPEKANLALGRLQSGLIATGGDTGRLIADLQPFLGALRLARAKTDETAGSVNNLGDSFASLGDAFKKQSATFGIADQLDAAQTALDELNQVKLDAAGQGQKSIDAARTEAQAQRSLTDAYQSQDSAAQSLADAKAKLAQFEGPTDTRIRSLELEQIQRRVVTTPEEARQKEIDLLKFSEDTANQRADLERQVQSAEEQLQSATEHVGDAQRAVSEASQARRQVQVDAAAAIGDAERKANEAILAAGTAILQAKDDQLIGNDALAAYIELLAFLEAQVAPGSPLSNNLQGLIDKMSLAALIKDSLGIRGSTGPGGTTTPPATPPATPAPDPRLSPGGATGATVQNFTTNATFNGGEVPTLDALNTLNRKQAIRLTASLSS